MGTAFPSRGGGAHFLLACLGDTPVCAALNVFQYAAYLIATALYGAGFSEYVGVLAGGTLPSGLLRLIGAGTVLLFLVVLLLFGSLHADPGRLIRTPWPDPGGVVTGAALLYVTFQGFGVVTNAAEEMSSPRRELPRAMFLALALVLIVDLLVSLLVVSLLPLEDIQRDAGHVLANAGAAL